jgi:hypothetical protein
VAPIRDACSLRPLIRDGTVAADHLPRAGLLGDGHPGVARNIAAIPVFIAAWLAETGSFSRQRRDHHDCWS